MKNTENPLLVGLPQPADEALAALDDCQTCGGSRKVPDISTFTKWCSELREEDEKMGYGYIKRSAKQRLELYDMYVKGDSHETKPCPDCQAKPEPINVAKALKLLELAIELMDTHAVWGEIKQAIALLKTPKTEPEPSGFVKTIRDYIQDFIHAEEHGIPMQNEPRVLERDLLEACDRIEQLERDCNCVKALCDSMDEFGEPMKDTQWTELGERIYEIVAELKAEKAKAELLIVFYLEGLKKSDEEIKQLNKRIVELKQLIVRVLRTNEIYTQKTLLVDLQLALKVNNENKS